MLVIDTPICFRRLRESDLPQITRLIQENLVWNLPESEREDGYLSVDFPPDTVKRMDESIPVIVGDRGDSLAGFLMGSTVADSGQIPILVKMIEGYGSFRFDGKFLNEYRSYVYGPVCVDRAVRGRGVIEGLFRESQLQLAGRFEVGVLFIAADNRRSIEAHRRKLGMELAGGFEFSGKMFHVLAFHVPPTKTAHKE